MKMTRLILIITILCTIFVIGVRTPESYEEGSITGGGTIKGKVTFKGEVPMRKVSGTSLNRERKTLVKPISEMLSGLASGILTG